MLDPAAGRAPLLPFPGRRAPGPPHPRDSMTTALDDALVLIEARRRSPLTIDEGIALVTHYPEAVAKNGGFSLLGVAAATAGSPPCGSAGQAEARVVLGRQPAHVAGLCFVR